MVYVKHPPPSRGDEGSRGDGDPILTLAQAANYMQLSESSLRIAIRQGRLRAFQRPGKRTLYVRLSEVRRFLDGAS
jgi:excisionase family DNA binding protein